MDDLWQNAWNDSPKDEGKSTVSALPNKEDVQRLPKLGVDDVAVWHATSPSASWEPEVQAKASVWGEDLSPWDPTTEPAQPDDTPRPESPVLSPEPEQAPSLPPSSPKVEVAIRIPSPEPEVQLPELHLPPELPTEFKPSFTPRSPTSPRATSPDGFGSFEVGQGDLEVEGETGWGSPRIAEEIAEDPGWGGHWNKESEPPKDAWTTAQEEQIRRNRKVPPALLNALLVQWKQFEEGVWPPESSESSESSSRQDRIEDMEKISKLTDMFLPPLSLAPPVSFSTTSTQKQSATAIKLTKSYKLAITSPLAHMRPSNGSDAWETHVKTYNEIDPAQLDQWAIDAARIESVPEDQPKATAAEKKGAAWSFWGRKQSSTTVPPRPASVSGTKSKVSSPASSARPSVEVSATSKPVDPPISIVPAAPIVIPRTTAKSPPLAEPPKLEDSFDEPPPQPSAVSRFFSRMTRNKSSEPTTKVNNRHSSFLSSNDIDFLSDVPSYNEEGDGDGLASLENMLSSSPPKSSKGPIPPLLAPPPKLNPPPSNPPQPKHPRALSLDLKPNVEDDFVDFLSAPSEGTNPGLPARSGTFLHTLPSPLTPSSGSSTSTRSPGPSRPGFPNLQPPSMTSPFSTHRSTIATPPVRSLQSDLGSLMDFGSSPTSPPPPMPPNNSQPSRQRTDIRNDEFDDFDSFVSGSGTQDDSFNSFTEASFAGSSVSQGSQEAEEQEQEHRRDESFDRDVSLFLGSSRPSNSINTPPPRDHSQSEFSDFSDFIGTSSVRSGSFSPPPEPPSKPSTPVRRQTQMSIRPSVAKLGATRVTMSSNTPARAATSSPAPLLPPPPGGLGNSRRTASMMDSPIETFSNVPSSFPPQAPIIGSSRTNSIGTIPILPSPISNGFNPPPSVIPPILPNPGSNGLTSPIPTASPHPRTGIHNSRQSSSSNVPILPQPSSGIGFNTGSNFFASSSPTVMPNIVPNIGKASSPAPLKPSATLIAPTSVGAKGLSAQDLSFFEGL